MTLDLDMINEDYGKAGEGYKGEVKTGQLTYDNLMDMYNASLDNTGQIGSNTSLAKYLGQDYDFTKDDLNKIGLINPKSMELIAEQFGLSIDQVKNQFDTTMVGNRSVPDLLSEFNKKFSNLAQQTNVASYGSKDIDQAIATQQGDIAKGIARQTAITKRDSDTAGLQLETDKRTFAVEQDTLNQFYGDIGSVESLKAASAGGGGTSFVCGQIRKAGNLTKLESLKMLKFLLKAAVTHPLELYWYVNIGQVLIGRAKVVNFD